MRKFILIVCVALATITGNAFAAVSSNTLSLGYTHATVKTPDNGKHDLKGTNFKFRHEFSSWLGLMGSFTLAKNENNHNGWYQGYGYDKDAGKWVQDKLMYGKVITEKQQYYSLSVGPSFRLNDYVSAYALAGASQTKSTVSTRQGKISDKHTAISYSAGVQVNPVKNWAIDVAYEGSGSGDWSTSAFIIGVGYRF